MVGAPRGAEPGVHLLFGADAQATAFSRAWSLSAGGNTSDAFRPELLEVGDLFGAAVALVRTSQPATPPAGGGTNSKAPLASGSRARDVE